MPKKVLGIFSYVTVLFLIVGILYAFKPKAVPPKVNTIVNAQESIPTPTPTPYILTQYQAPQIPKKDVYKIALLGDSMTAALGPHGGEMSEYLNDLYKDGEDSSQGIIIDNYAISSSILAIENQISKKLTVSEYTFGPMIGSDYDLIIIESFGYNPLSEFGLEEGIKRQNEVLKKLVEKLIVEMPKTSIVFAATIAPDRDNYGKSTQPNMLLSDRQKLADERIAYLKNHIDFAQKYNIPLINIYEKSLSTKGDGDLKYINANDDIHPSFQGVTFIGREIGNYIFDNNILPK